MYLNKIRTSFNDGWRFMGPGKNDMNISPAMIPNDAEQICLPHAWNYVGWNYEHWKPESNSGTGWYFKKLPEHDHSEKLVLKFEGVAAECEIFLNGIPLLYNIGAYLPFEVELSACKGDGTDLLAVRVTDKPGVRALDEDKSDPFRKSPRYRNWAIPKGSSIEAGGIWRDVWLERRSAANMQTPVVSTFGDLLEVTLDICGDCAVACCKLYDAEARMLAETSVKPGAGVFGLTLSVPGHHDWHPVSPYLYELQTVLFDKQGVELQQITQPVAFFNFRVRDSEFYVNEKPYFLRGQNGFPHCNIPHDREYISRYVAKIKSLGVEISRFHTEPPSHVWLDECDRQGVMVIFEMPLHGSICCYPFGNPIFAANAIREMCALVKEYRRHPSIVMWSLGNELIVSSERDIKLGEPLFDILEQWVTEIRKLDFRPVIANSGGDAVDLVQKSIGDVDDVHQYGGWYIDNLYEVGRFAEYSRKNDMVFQPMLSTESVAAYTNNNGEFMINDSDVRQRKVVTMRMGKINNLREDSLAMQSFILKEYAESMWRRRHSDSNFGGYIPFGQYTWFFDPFDKGPDGLREKPIWEVYRKVMGPVHVQLECWSRHVQKQTRMLAGNLLLCHEDIKLPEYPEFTIEIKLSGKSLYRETVAVRYHHRFTVNIRLCLPELCQGDHRLEISADCNGKKAADNYLDFKIYDDALDALDGKSNIVAYDPTNKLSIPVIRISQPKDINNFSPADTIFIVGPYAMDEYVAGAAKVIYEWCACGGSVVVLEQNPCPATDNILNTGVKVVRKTQPYWSRWAANSIRHADRVDICEDSHPMFAGLTESDMKWWNGDTYLAHNFLQLDDRGDSNCKVLSRIGNGLMEDELMPLEYEYMDSGYSLTAFEFSVGLGSILISSLLIGSKSGTEPVARKILNNLITAKREYGKISGRKAEKRSCSGKSNAFYLEPAIK